MSVFAEFLRAPKSRTAWASFLAGNRLGARFFRMLSLCPKRRSLQQQKILPRISLDPMTEMVFFKDSPVSNSNRKLTSLKTKINSKPSKSKARGLGGNFQKLMRFLESLGKAARAPFRGHCCRISYIFLLWFSVIVK